MAFHHLPQLNLLYYLSPFTFFLIFTHFVISVSEKVLKYINADVIIITSQFVVILLHF